MAHCAQLGAVDAYQAGSNRLALAGLGTAMEAVLIDFLQRQTPGDLKSAAAQCKQTKNRWFNATDPTTWALVDLMRGCVSYWAWAMLTSRRTFGNGGTSSIRVRVSKTISWTKISRLRFAPLLDSCKSCFAIYPRRPRKGANRRSSRYSAKSGSGATEPSRRGCPSPC